MRHPARILVQFSSLPMSTAAATLQHWKYGPAGVSRFREHLSASMFVKNPRPQDEALEIAPGCSRRAMPGALQKQATPHIEKWPVSLPALATAVHPNHCLSGFSPCSPDDFVGDRDSPFAAEFPLVNLAHSPHHPAALQPTPAAARRIPGADPPQCQQKGSDGIILFGFKR